MVHAGIVYRLFIPPNMTALEYQLIPERDRRITEEQDTAKAARDAKRKTKARQIDHAKAIDRVLDYIMDELAEDKQNAVTSSLEHSYRQVYADIARELEENRRAIDADRDGETRMADARDYTNKRRTAPETKIPQSMPRFGAYGESVVFGAPSPDQVKAVLNAEFNGKDYSQRIWQDRDKLARELKDMMSAAIINGENSRIVSQKLAQRMGVDFSHAQRLIRTEQSRVLNQAHADRMQKEGIKKYRFVAIHDDRTCGRCLKKDGKSFAFKDRKVGLNFPPLHPHCRCTIIADMDPDDDGKDWLDNLLDEWKAGKLTPRGELEALIAKKDGAVTQKEADAAVAAEDAAMKEAEQRQTTALGIQRRAIQQGKPTKTEKNSREISNTKAQGNVSKVATRSANRTTGDPVSPAAGDNSSPVATRSANRTTGDRNADRTTTTHGDAVREIAQEIKEEYQAKRTDEEKALIRELVESGRKCKSEEIIQIDKADAGGIVWMETGTENAGLIHILKHQKELKARGIEKKEIPRFTAEIIKKGEIVSGTKSKNGKEGLLLRYGEKLYIISVGDNGFIVGLYPVREGERYEKTSYDAGYNRAVALGLR